MACVTKRRNRWVLDYYDQHGHRRWKTMPEGATKEGAKEELAKIEKLVKAGAYLPKAKEETLAFSKVATAWLKIKKRKVRHSTLTAYKSHITEHLEPHFGNMLVTRINLEVVEGFLAKCEEKGVSVATTRKVLTTLGAILIYACRKKYIDHNPVSFAEKPSKEIDTEEAEEVEIYTPDQVRKLINATGWVKRTIKDNQRVLWSQMEPTTRMKYKTLIMMAVGTGARQGELLGSKWKDVDWEAAQFEVKRTFNHGRSYQPKTKASRRKIDLPPQLINQLAEWEKHCPESDMDLVFPNGNGNHINPANIYNRVYCPAIEKAGVPKLKFHALRHTYASILIDNGENPKYIQTQMGHSSIKVTYDIYGHLLDKQNPEAANRLGNVVFAGFKSRILESGSKMVAIEAWQEKKESNGVV